MTSTTEGYIEFLHALLATHNHNIYKINKKKTYNFKYLYPPSKPYSTFFLPCSPKLTRCTTCSQKDAIDVDTLTDFKSFVEKLRSEKPAKVKVFVDMNVVAKLPRQTSSGDNNTSDHSESDAEVVCICLQDCAE
ncbi:hypothetical protein JVT61DRAFT_3689 [Boletus reticuloceps]|uniref:Uncharacterized protein n=1 Tax=Boletus reticuloceps TaxID=495285 RepID=A0A8I2YND1_9AGAM|nr:hypothetical protein JVT61DRAFT_3689 [Boletus reticuloceps]